MVVEIENPANRAMHYGDNRILVNSIEVPNKLPQKVLYSAIEANRIHDRIENDIYDGLKKAKPYERSKFPTILKIIGGAIGLAAIICKGKSILKAIKNIFK